MRRWQSGLQHSPFIAAPISANAEMLMLWVRGVTFQTAAFPCREHNTVTDYVHLSLWQINSPVHVAPSAAGAHTWIRSRQKVFKVQFVVGVKWEEWHVRAGSVSDTFAIRSWKVSQKCSALQRWCYEPRIREWYLDSRGIVAWIPRKYVHLLTLHPKIKGLFLRPFLHIFMPSRILKAKYLYLNIFISLHGGKHHML